MKLEDYQKPTYIPGWLEKVLYVQQQEKLPVYKYHAEVVKSFYQEQDCNTVVDLGCWLGAFAYNMKKELNPGKLTIIDAVPTYLYMAKQLLTKNNLQENVEVCEMTVADSPNDNITHFVVNLERTIETSSVLSKVKDNTISFNLPVVRPTSSAQAAVKLFEIAGNNCYMKIDVDGMDYNLISEMGKINFFPRVMHFEAFLFNKNDIMKCLNVLEQLSQFGFKTPKPSEVLDKRIADIIVSRNRYFVIDALK